MDLERSILKIIRGEKRVPLVKGGLAGLSGIYRLALAARNFAYDRGWLPSVRLPVPVISIGNIVAGGTGKTPLVHLLASHLQDKIQLAILTRGFRSKIEKSGESRLISSGNGPLCSPQECGDEPYFLAQKMKAAIWVGPDRVLSGQLAIEQGAQCLLLDDGMQHRRLKRDFEIVVIDGLDPFSKGRFLPWGLLRDSPKRLRSADLIVLTHVRDVEHYKQLQKEISLYSDAPLTGVQIAVVNERRIGRKVGVFCGIGNPERFVQTVRDLKWEIVNTLFLKDHEPIQNSRLQKFAKECRTQGAEALVCTEKDYVKLYRAEEGFVNLGSARQRKIEAKRSESCNLPVDGCRSLRSSNSDETGTPDEKDRFWKATASPNSQNLTERGIGPDSSLCLKIEPVEIRLQIIAGKEDWEGLVKKILGLSNE